MKVSKYQDEVTVRSKEWVMIGKIGLIALLLLLVCFSANDLLDGANVPADESIAFESLNVVADVPLLQNLEDPGIHGLHVNDPSWDRDLGTANSTNTANATTVDDPPKRQNPFPLIKNKVLREFTKYMALIVIFLMIFLCHLWEIISGFFCCICCCHCPWFWKWACPKKKRTTIGTKNGLSGTPRGTPVPNGQGKREAVV